MFEPPDYPPADQPSSRIKVGKLDTKNLFQEAESSAESGVVVVGKLNTKNLFLEPVEEAKPRMKVGRIKASSFLLDSQASPTEAEEAAGKVVVGKLNADNIFPVSPTQGEEIKLYKPVVQPKKMDIDKVFPLGGEGSNKYYQECHIHKHIFN